MPQDEKVHDGCRRQTQKPNEWTKNVKKKARHSLEIKNIISPVASCKHTVDNPKYGANNLSTEEKEGNITFNFGMTCGMSCDQNITKKCCF